MPPERDEDKAVAIAARLAELRRGIAEAAARAGRAGHEPDLLAVGKGQPQDAVRAALAAGQRLFGENRVQEAAAKYAGLRGEFPDLRLHLIGPLQTNKLRDALHVFDVIETVDRPRLAEAMADELRRDSGRLDYCLIEVNTGEEPQKAGVHPADADEFIRDCRVRLGLPVRGLMCVPPVDDEPALHFALLREIARRHGLTVLSMGMSGDFPIALEQGSTELRIGSAIFGARRLPAA